jgi:hypothetical protein
MFSDIPWYAQSAISNAFATILPPGARIAAYVNSNGWLEGDNVQLQNDVVTTLNAGLAKCRSGRGDVVIVMPTHAENISAADQMSSLVAGTTIVGLGSGLLRPTFTWTAATATFLFDQANTKLINCVLRCAGPLTSTTAISVAAPITVSAAGCAIRACDINVGVDADQLATIGITTTAGGTDLEVADCRIWGNAGSAVTTCVRLVGATRLKMDRTDIIAETSAAGVGVVQCITTASTQVRFRDCLFTNEKSDSTAAFTGLAACTGTLVNCGFGYYGNSGTTAITTQGDLQCFNCWSVNEQGETSINSTVVSA